MSDNYQAVLKANEIDLITTDYHGASIPAIARDDLLDALSTSPESRQLITDVLNDPDKGIIYFPISYALTPEMNKPNFMPKQGLKGVGDSNLFASIIKIGDNKDECLIHSTYHDRHLFVHLVPVGLDGAYGIKRVIARADVLTDGYFSSMHWMEVEANFVNSITAISAASPLDEVTPNMLGAATGFMAIAASNLYRRCEAAAGEKTPSHAVAKAYYYLRHFKSRLEQQDCFQLAPADQEAIDSALRDFEPVMANVYGQNWANYLSDMEYEEQRLLRFSGDIDDDQSQMPRNLKRGNPRSQASKTILKDIASRLKDQFANQDACAKRCIMKEDTNQLTKNDILDLYEAQQLSNDAFTGLEVIGYYPRAWTEGLNSLGFTIDGFGFNIFRYAQAMSAKDPDIREALDKMLADPKTTPSQATTVEIGVLGRVATAIVQPSLHYKAGGLRQLVAA